MGQQLAARLGKGQITPLVEHHEIHAAQILRHSALTPCASLHLDPVHQIDHVEVAAKHPAADAGPGDRDGEVGFADPSVGFPPASRSNPLPTLPVPPTSTTLRRYATKFLLARSRTSTSLIGAGEWPVKKHGERGTRTWRKLHLAVNPNTGEILASELTTSDEGDASQVGPLLGQIPGLMASVTDDGAYDGEPIYRMVWER